MSKICMIWYRYSVRKHPEVYVHLPLSCVHVFPECKCQVLHWQLQVKSGAGQLTQCILALQLTIEKRDQKFWLKKVYFWSLLSVCCDFMWRQFLCVFQRRKFYWAIGNHIFNREETWRRNMQNVFKFKSEYI